MGEVDVTTAVGTRRAEIRSAVDLPLMPAALGSQTPRIRVDSEHEAPYGTFREARP